MTNSRNEMNPQRILKWYEWMWGGMPLLLTLVGGVVGGLVGAAFTSANIKLSPAASRVC